MENFYKEFERTSKEKWLIQVEKELRTELKPVFLDPTISYSPFLGFDDSKENPLSNSKTKLGWVISQKIDSKIPEEINKEILLALEGGAGAISLHITQQWDENDFASAFAAVFLNFITIRLEFSNSNTIICLHAFKSYLENSNYNLNELNIYIPVAGNNDLLACTFEFLKFEVFAGSASTISERLCNELKLAENLRFQESLEPTIAFKVQAEENFFLNIAQIKTLRNLWIKIQEAYGVVSLKEAILHFQIPSIQDEPNLGVIISTQMAMAGAIAGADLMEIENLGFDPEIHTKDFSWRISRNIQNILQHESFLNKTLDASEGSYLLDDLTRNLMEQVWKSFIQD
jgi:methylmalonyl-CoA mutase